MLDTINCMLAAVNNGLGIDPIVRRNVIMAFGILLTLASIAMIIVVMLQKGTNDDVGVISGSSTDTFYGKNKERNKESILKKITIGLFAFIIVCAIICTVISLLD